LLIVSDVQGTLNIKKRITFARSSHLLFTNNCE